MDVYDPLEMSAKDEWWAAMNEMAAAYERYFANPTPENSAEAEAAKIRSIEAETKYKASIERRLEAARKKKEEITDV